MKHPQKETSITYLPTPVGGPESYFDGVHVHGNAASGTYIHENVVIDPDIQVRCFTYEDMGILVPGHWHNSLEILLLDAGEMEVFINGWEGSLTEGDFILINSREIHSTSCSEHSRVAVLQIPYPFLKQHIPDYDLIHFRSGPCGDEAVDSLFRQHLAGLQQCHRMGGSYYQLHFASLLYELLHLCVTCYRLPAETSARRMTDEEQGRLITVMDYVNAHYSEPVTLKQAASLVALNPEYFCRFFKKNMGLTFLEFVNQIRFSHVCEDILRTDSSITELLSLHGFGNYKLFRRMFYEKYGCTPSVKRREASGKKSFHDSTQNEQRRMRT